MNDGPTDETARGRTTPTNDTTNPRNTDAMTHTPDEIETDPTTSGSRTDPTTDPAIDSTAATDGGTADEDSDPAEESDSRLSRLSSDDLRGLLDRIGLAALVLLALIAGWSFYGQTGRAIRTWLDPAYHPIALAAFNLAVLFVALAGVTHQLRRIRAGDGEGAEPTRTEEPEPSRTEDRRTSEDANR